MIALGIVGYTGWNYAIHNMLESMIEQSIGKDFNLDNILQQDQEADPSESRDAGDNQTGGGGQPEANHSDKDQPTNGDKSNNQDGGGSAAGGGGIPSKPSGGSTDNTKGTADGSVDSSKPSGGSSSDKTTTGTTGQPKTGSGNDSAPTSDGNGSASYDPSISVEKAKQVQESITLKEKTKVTSVLAKRLSPGDLSTLMKLAGNGMTVTEKKEAKKMLLEKLSEKEYNELIDIAQKYGLSQGKK